MCSESLERTARSCEALEARWEEHRTQYFSASLADLEHRYVEYSRG
jgi:hypothetical protein